LDSVIKSKKRKVKRGFRLSRRLERKRKLRRILLIVVGVALVAGVGFCFRGQISKCLTASKSPAESSNKDVKASVSSSKPELGNKVIFLVMGTETKDGKEDVDEVLALFCDFEEGILNGISVPKDAIIEVPGLGFERVGKMLSSGKDATALSAIQNLFGVKLYGYAKLNFLDLERIMDKNDFENIFKLSVSSDISSKDREKISSSIASMNHQEDISIVPLPVKNHAVGEEIYFEPDKKKMEELVSVLWGIKIEKEETIRVMILNGCGVPGVAGEVANKLINTGYQVVGTKNADNFSYEETQILVYNKDDDAAESIKDVLKAGVIIDRAITQEVADIVIVVGKDYDFNGEEN